MHHVEATEVDYVQRSYTRGKQREEKGEYHGRQKIKLEREVFYNLKGTEEALKVLHAGAGKTIYALQKLWTLSGEWFERGTKSATNRCLESLRVQENNDGDLN